MTYSLKYSFIQQVPTIISYNCQQLFMLHSVYSMNKQCKGKWIHMFTYLYSDQPCMSGGVKHYLSTQNQNVYIFCREKKCTDLVWLHSKLGWDSFSNFYELLLSGVALNEFKKCSHYKTKLLNSLVWTTKFMSVYFGRDYTKPTLIASCMRPQSAALMAISLYDIPGAYPSFSAISRATCSLSSWVCFTCSKNQHYNIY